MKAQCLLDRQWTGEQLERLCYNDIQPLYELRGIDTHTPPYIVAYMGEDGLKAGGIEYPVLTGLFMWGVGYLADDPDGYFRVTAVLLVPFALLIVLLLFRMGGSRAFYWAAAPTLALYAFHNWDLLVVAAAVAGLYLWRGGRYTAAAIMLGVGGALKLYPLLFLAPLFLERWMEGDRSGARRSVAWGLGTCFAINLPVIYLNPPSWWLTYDFHRQRGPNVDSLWAQTFPELGPSSINAMSAALTLVTVAAVLWWCWARARDRGGFPFLQASGAVLCAFLLWSKVQSPQYMLWVLPFFVLLRVGWGWWVAFTVVDVASYVGVFRYLHSLDSGSSGDAALTVMVVAVLARAALWAFLIVVFGRAQTAGAATLPFFRESRSLEPVTPSS